MIPFLVVLCIGSYYLRLIMSYFYCLSFLKCMHKSMNIFFCKLVTLASWVTILKLRFFIPLLILFRSSCLTTLALTITTSVMLLVTITIPNELDIFWFYVCNCCSKLFYVGLILKKCRKCFFYIDYKCNRCKIFYLITTMSRTFIYFGYFTTNVKYFVLVRFIQCFWSIKCKKFK